MSEPLRIFAKDYQATEYCIPETTLFFDLDDHATVVRSKLKLERRGKEDAPLVLNGEELILLSLKCNGVELSKDQYIVEEESLTIKSPLPSTFTLEVETRIDPANNLKLEGLYKSGQLFCTQMESEGFRRVTYYLDRPDVLSKFTTRIEGDLATCPQLLSNGNLIEKGHLSAERHFAVWEDPHPKPCYLFALVAGDLGVVSTEFITSSKRKVLCEVYVDKGNEGRAHHALGSLTRAMKWDEDVFGREYDLDLYMIVAVDAFNFGAMENKGLNVFNSSAVLADPSSATDMDYQRIEGIVAHEYFHNWTGNRVTCRDWFQLTLKEGLTVFRDQEFSSDTHHRSVFRIQEVASLRERQFPEDNGPNAHPIKPPSYIEINNFYTSTIYEKGAEVIRMIHTLLGKDGFRRGMDLYFERHDGQAVCTEDFVAAMAEANGKDLANFEAAWYHQAGTPRLLVKGTYLPEESQYTLTVEQILPDAAGDTARAYTLPIRFALLDGEGGHLPLKIKKDDKSVTEIVLEVEALQQSFTFVDIHSEPIPSLLRGFSAPVILEMERNLTSLLKAWTAETDDFNRFELGQEIMTQQITSLLKGQTLDGRFLQAYRQMLLQPMEHAIKAEIMGIPSLNMLLEKQQNFDPSAVHKARLQLQMELAEFCKEECLDLYARLHRKDDRSMSTIDMGRRRLKNTCLTLLSQLKEPEMWEMAIHQYRHAANMTDTMTSLSILADAPDAFRLEALKDFENKWKEDAVVMNKWFLVQSSALRDDLIEELEILEDHVSYNGKNPNKVRALLGGFTRNLVAFHAQDGSGYSFLASRIAKIDTFNSGLASSLARAFAKFPNLGEPLAEKMELELKKILLLPKLSRDVYEIVSKTLSSRKN
jgi:aminopeptidase N